MYNSHLQAKEYKSAQNVNENSPKATTIIISLSSKSLLINLLTYNDSL
jgi:hypothetical protein